MKSDDTRTTPRTFPEPIMADEQGGDSACWLDRVCPECGAFNDHPGHPCWRCGHPTITGDDQTPPRP